MGTWAQGNAFAIRICHSIRLNEKVAHHSALNNNNNDTTTNNNGSSINSENGSIIISIIYRLQIGSDANSIKANYATALTIERQIAQGQSVSTKCLFTLSTFTR